MANELIDLTNRIQLLEKNFNTHLGPAYAATSMNIPHADTASGTDLAALTARVVILEADMATAQGDITSLQSDMTTAQSDISTLQTEVATLQTQMTAAQAAIITSGRYM